jgi:FkbM family methyltransferase
MIKLINIIAGLMKFFPETAKNFIFETVLNFFPIWLIKKIPCSYAAYLKCYCPKKGDVIIDCGAHIGNCTLLFSRLVGKNGLVIALEPFAESFNTIKKRIKRLKKNNICAINKGVWNHSGKFSLSVFENTISCKVSENQNDANNTNYKIVNCTTIDDIANDLGLNRIDMIKMDIEGAEIEALQGAVSVIKKFQPVFAVASYHEREGKQTHQKVEQMLREQQHDVITFFPPHLTTCGKNTSPLR